MTFTIWGRASSTNVQKVTWALTELDLPYERIDCAGPYGKTDTPEFFELNPNRRVPVLQEGDFTLWESHAILRFLARRTGRLMPEGEYARALADQWLDFTATTFQPPSGGIFWQVFRNPEGARDEARLKEHRGGLAGAFAAMETRLGAHDWLTGDDFGMADIAAGALMYRLGDMGYLGDIPDGVARWHARLADRPAYRTIVEYPYDELLAY